MRRHRRFLGHEIEPGWHFSIMDGLFDHGWPGCILWGLLFIPAGLICIPVFTILAWVLNPPWMEYED